MQTRAVIERVTPLTDSIVQLILAPEVYVEYQAGQYLQVELGSGDEGLYYSIANAPLGSKTYELHLRHSPDNDTVKRLLNEVKAEGALTVRLPFGECELSRLDASKPILFIAGGTGFAPVKAMIEQLLMTAHTEKFSLLWGARADNDLYMHDKVLQWQAHVQHFNYTSVISQNNQSTLVEALMAEHGDALSDWQFVISGPFEMVYAVRDALVARGVARDALFSDAFAFEQAS